MLLAAKDIELFNNTITNNNVMRIGIISYITLAFIDLGNTYDDSLYVPYGSNIYIHDNTMSRTTTYPTDQNDVAQLLTDQWVHDKFARIGKAKLASC